jgi:two-component system, chemotaxis family, CheB/CheR fusion protein
LIVDDNVDAADSLSFALHILQYRVQVAYNGLEGVAAALEDPPDVVLLDIGMPSPDGFEVATRIRRVLGPAVLLIAHTAWGDVATLRRCKEAGFDHHLTKPADLSDILALIDPRGSASLGPQRR